MACRGLPALPLRSRLLSPVGRVIPCAPARELPRDRTSLYDDEPSPALSASSWDRDPAER
jgi:hypothetical protein